MKIRRLPKIMSATAAKLVRQLSTAGEAGLPRTACGGCQMSRQIAPAALVADLLARDWIAATPERVRLTSPGLRALERHDAPKTSDGFAQQNRILTRCKRRVPGTVVDVNLAESPLGWLRRRALIDDRQWQAGERLRTDFYLGSSQPRITMKWDAPPIGKTARGPADHMDPSLAQLSAKQRFGAAMSAAGPGLSDVLWRVVCSGEGLETAEKALGWPARAGKLVLTLGLDRVAQFYRI
jgi:hypothetical protein